MSATPVLFNRRPTKQAGPDLFAWEIGPLMLEVFRGQQSGKFYWTLSYVENGGMAFGPVSDQIAQDTIELAIHAAENALLLLKLTLEGAARFPSPAPG